MSIFPMPVSVEKKLDQIMRNFFWGSSTDARKINWIAWHRICKARKMGGLGIRNLKLTNKALLSKWTWRYFKEKQLLWRRIIQEKMRAKSEHLWVKDSNKPQGRGIWKGIQKQKILVEDMSVTQVKKGDAVLFWWEKWLGNQALKHKFPNIYKISTQKNASILEVIVNAAWNLKFRRNLTQAEMPEMVTLFAHIGSPPSLDENAEDEVLCTLVDGFKVKTCYNSLIQQLPADPVMLPVNYIWINFVPPKVQILIWSAAQNAIDTTDNLQYRGCTFQNPICSLCNLKQESVNHLLLHCEFTHIIWNYFIWGYNVRWAQASSIISLLEAW